MQPAAAIILAAVFRHPSASASHVHPLVSARLLHLSDLKPLHAVVDDRVALQQGAISGPISCAPFGLLSGSGIRTPIGPGS